MKKRPILKERILAALRGKILSSAQLQVIVGTTKSGMRDPMLELRKLNLVEQVGTRDLERGFGTEMVWGLVKPKTQAKNAFDWQNWTPKIASHSKRDIALSPSQFAIQNEKRNIIYTTI